MKKLITIVAAILVAGAMNAQKVNESDVPSPVKSKFASLHPDVKMERWKMEKGNYAAEFEHDKTKMCEIIDPSGNLVKTKMEIKQADLPQAAVNYMNKTYPGKKISEIHKMTDAHGAVSYKAEVDDNYIFFDANGNYSKQVSEDEMKEHRKEQKKEDKKEVKKMDK